MIRPQFSLDLHDELIVDNFAGGGGASTGIELATGRHVDHAVNHDWAALGMHRINHPQTVHHCEDVFDVDPSALTEGRPVGLGWFSPDCKHFSKAKGGKPLSKRIRGLAFVILRWVKIRSRVIYMENVEEIQGWGPLLPDGRPDKSQKGRTWRAFLDVLGPGIDPNHPDISEMLEVLGDSVTREELVRGFGYDVKTREIRACDYGAPTIRKRLYLVGRCDGQPIVWPEASHAAPEHAKGLKLKPYRAIAECIEWNIPCNSIFLSSAEAKKVRCRRPLANSTLRRIAKGVDRYVLKAKKPFLVSLTHQGGDRVESIDEPIRTITGANRGEKGFVDATVAPVVTEHANATHQRNFAADEPLRTQCAEVKGGHFGLVAAGLARTAHGDQDKNGKKRGKGEHAVTDPLPSILASQDCALFSAHLCREFGESVGQSVDSPAPTVMPHGQGKSSLISAHLTKFHGNHAGKLDGGNRNQSPDDPLKTQDISNRHGLVAANMVKLRGTNVGHGADEPGHTSSAGGQHHALSTAYLAQHNGGNATNPGHHATSPASTISSKGSQQQVVTGNLCAYYGNDEDGQGLEECGRTVTTRDRFGLAVSEAFAPPMTPDQFEGARRVAAFLRSYGVEFEGEFATVAGFVIVDIGMRMLTPRELFRAQGFPDSYVIDRAWVIDPKTGDLTDIALTKEQQIRMCGNSVCPPVARALIRANSPDLCLEMNRRVKNGKIKNRARSRQFSEVK